LLLSRDTDEEEIEQCQPAEKGEAKSFGENVPGLPGIVVQHIYRFPEIGYQHRPPGADRPSADGREVLRLPLLQEAHPEEVPSQAPPVDSQRREALHLQVLRQGLHAQRQLRLAREDPALARVRPRPQSTSIGEPRQRGPFTETARAPVFAQDAPEAPADHREEVRL